MRGSRRATALAAMVVLVFAGSILPATVEASSNAFKRAHWRTARLPFDLLVGDNVGRDWDELLVRAADQWSASDVVDMRVVDGKSSRAACPPTEGRVEVCSDEYGTNGNLGITILKLDPGSHIEWATVKLNDSYFTESGGQYNSEEARRHTVCHELGHALGLPHPSNKSRSCLNDSLKRLELTLTPSKEGIQVLKQRYDHRHGNGRAADATIEGTPAQVDPAAIAAVEAGAVGDVERFEVPLPDGGKLVAIPLHADE